MYASHGGVSKKVEAIGWVNRALHAAIWPGWSALPWSKHTVGDVISRN